jgi:alpha-beta hydrolase superfamily lysophospholipase
LEAYQAAGLKNLTYRAYPEGRHESLNEVNREEVTHDLIAWLDSIVKNSGCLRRSTSG